MALSSDSSILLNGEQKKENGDVSCTGRVERKTRGWYLDLMVPNCRGPNMAWLDPTAMYLNTEAMEDMLTDLLSPFDVDSIDMVAGIDATGFILGAALASRCKRGFLALRKKGHLVVDTYHQTYTDYQKGEKTLEIRTNPFPKGSRVLVYDEWIETGGTMNAATSLIEQAGGVVMGIAVIACEDFPLANELKRKYKIHTLIPEELQPQIDAHYLESFKRFEETE